MIKLSFYKDLEPRLKRLLDELSTRAVNGNTVPLFVDYNTFKVGVGTITPTKPFDIAVETRITSLLTANHIAVLGSLHARNIDVPGTLSANDLTVQGMARLNNTDVVGTFFVSRVVNIGSGESQSLIAFRSDVAGQERGRIRFSGASGSRVVEVGVLNTANEDTSAITFAQNPAALKLFVGNVERFRVDADGGLQSFSTEPATPTANTLYTSNIVKGWIGFSMSTGTISASFNVSSVVDGGVGDWDINWNTDFSSGSTVTVGAANRDTDVHRTIMSHGPTVGVSRVMCGQTSTTATFVDATYVQVMAIGRQ